MRLGGFLEGFRGVLEASWGIFGASWTRLGENVEKRSRATWFLEGFWEPEWRKQQLAFPSVFSYVFVIFHVFESQLVKTCPRKVLAKHWLVAQKLTFARG